MDLMITYTYCDPSQLHLKPDIAGIGGTVFSTYPVSMGKLSFIDR